MRPPWRESKPKELYIKDRLIEMEICGPLPPLEPAALPDVNGLVRLEAGNSLGPAAGPGYFNVRFGRAPEAEVKARVVRGEIASAGPDRGVLRQPARGYFHPRPHRHPIAFFARELDPQPV